MAVVRDGVVEIDHSIGTRDGASPWTSNTLVMTYSVAKPFAALAFLDAVAEGLIGLDQPVTSVWPAFGQSGKESTTMRHLLSHQAGLPAFPEKALEVEYDDREALVDLLADAAPIHAPGAGVAEHALTYGHLLDEVLRRATGEPLAERFARFAGAAGWDLHLRVEEHDLTRVATLVDPTGTWQLGYLEDPTMGPGPGPTARTARPGGAELGSLQGHVVPSRGLARHSPLPGDLLRRRDQTRGSGGRSPRSRPVAGVRRARGNRSRSGARSTRHLDPRLPARRRDGPGRARDGWCRWLLSVG